MDPDAHTLAVQTVLLALISTHPKPKQLRQAIDTIAASMQVAQVKRHNRVTPEFRRDYPKAIEPYLNALDEITGSTG